MKNLNVCLVATCKQRRYVESNLLWAATMQGYPLGQVRKALSGLLQSGDLVRKGAYIQARG